MRELSGFCVAALSTFLVFFVSGPATAQISNPGASCQVKNPVQSPNLKFTFTGQCVDGFVSGSGILQWSSNGLRTTREEGEWKSGARFGKGVNEYADGDRYEGDFVDGMRTGTGTYLWLDGQHYEGQFLDGALSGKGILTALNGDRYEGQFENNRQTGEGDVIRVDGSRVHGATVEAPREQELPVHLPMASDLCVNILNAAKKMKYPTSARSKGLMEGRVFIEFQVDGETSSNFVVKRSSDPAFEPMALAAAKSLRCTSSEPVVVFLPLTFELHRE